MKFIIQTIDIHLLVFANTKKREPMIALEHFFCDATDAIIILTILCQF